MLCISQTAQHSRDLIWLSGHWSTPCCTVDWLSSAEMHHVWGAVWGIRHHLGAPLQTCPWCLPINFLLSTWKLSWSIHEADIWPTGGSQEGRAGKQHRLDPSGEADGQPTDSTRRPTGSHETPGRVHHSHEPWSGECGTNVDGGIKEMAQGTAEAWTITRNDVTGTHQHSAKEVSTMKEATPSSSCCATALKENLLTSEGKVPFLTWCPQTQALKVSPTTPICRVEMGKDMDTEKILADIQQSAFGSLGSFPEDFLQCHLATGGFEPPTSQDSRLQLGSSTCQGIQGIMKYSLRIFSNPSQRMCYCNSVMQGLIWLAIRLHRNSQSNWSDNGDIFGVSTQLTPIVLDVSSSQPFARLLTRWGLQHSWRRQHDATEFLLHLLLCVQPAFWCSDWIPKWMLSATDVADGESEKGSKWLFVSLDVTHHASAFKLEHLVTHWHDETGHQRPLSGWTVLCRLHQ